MISCLKCGKELKSMGNYCMAKECQNFKKKKHYHDNIDHYRAIKREEQKRNIHRRNKKRREYAANKYYNDIIGTILTSTKHRAKKSQIDFDLDRDFLCSLYEDQSGCCALTKIEFQLDKSLKHRRRPFGPSLDRVESNKGYTKDNVRFVCSIVNIALSDFGDDAFVKMCKAFVLNNK